MKKMLERDIQRTICDWLFLNKYFFWRQNNIPVFHEGKFRAMPKYSSKGSPDIFILSRGKFIGLEVKNKIRGTPQSEHQKEFEESMKNNGGHYAIVKSLEDTIIFLDSISFHTSPDS